MPNSKVQDKTRSIPSVKPLPSTNDSMSTLAEDEIRSRAYQIYEARGGTGNHADEDWAQAEIELMELVHRK